MCRELGRLSQGYKHDVTGTDTVFFLTHQQIKSIPTDRTVTYAKIVVNYRPQKEDLFQVRITVGGNLIEYPGTVHTPTADLILCKLL